MISKMGREGLYDLSPVVNSRTTSNPSFIRWHDRIPSPAHQHREPSLLAADRDYGGRLPNLARTAAAVFFVGVFPANHG